MDNARTGTEIGMLGLLGASVGAGLLLHYADSRRFNNLAAGLTMEQRQIAKRFWKASRKYRNEEHAKYAAAMAKLEHVEAARVALEKLDQTIALHGDPTCDQDVAVWLTAHWMREAAIALRGKPSMAMERLIKVNLDSELSELQQRVFEYLEATVGVDR